MLNGLSLSTIGNPLGTPSATNPPAAQRNQSDSRRSAESTDGDPNDPEAQAIALLKTYGFVDGSSPQDPLGDRGDMGLATNAGLREIDALIKLVRQLSDLALSEDRFVDGHRADASAGSIELLASFDRRGQQKSAVTFYGLDVYGLGVCQDSSTKDCATATTASAASVSLVQQSARAQPWAS